MMSIITEALKKIQTGRYDQVVEGNREEQNGVPAAARAEQRSPGSRSLFFNVLLACAVAGIISAGMLFLWRNRQSVMEMPVFGKRAVISSGLEVGDVEHTATVPPGETVHDDISKTPLTGQRHLAISGIMYSPSHPQAIINGRIISEGETVDGFTVNHIGPGTVRGILNDEDFELELE